MKKRYKYFLFFCFITFWESVQAQNYLPLEIGNRWDFCNYNKDAQQLIHQEKSSTVKVLKDTVMPNGKDYYFLEGHGSFIPQFVRTDNSWLYYYEESDSNEYTLLNFNAEVGDSFYNVKMGDWTFLVNRDTLSIFNQKMIKITFNSYLGSDNINTVSFSDKLGLLGGANYFYEEVNYSELSGCMVSGLTYGTLLSITKYSDNVPKNFILYQNYPNPFNPTTIINYSIPKTSFVSIKVYNVLGKEIQTLVNDQKSAGNYKIEFDGSKLASGIYIYRMQASDFIGIKKLILLK